MRLLVRTKYVCPLKKFVWQVYDKPTQISVKYRIRKKVYEYLHCEGALMQE